MKKLYIFAVLALTVSLAGATSALASVGDMPEANALSYGQNAQGCYYISPAKERVYTKDFSAVISATSNCDRTEKISAIYRKYLVDKASSVSLDFPAQLAVVGIDALKWRENVRQALLNLAK
jgi:hypothetical protein